ncbi:MAG TPA: hypothetical protein VJ799_00970 [Nitrososphaeraceae archaeon]|jgi:hypothetical protein|nr:hypothetical protein [Nitrososphaeraceae archaeon]
MKISASTAATITIIAVSLILTSFTIGDAVAQQANTTTSNSSGTTNSTTNASGGNITLGGLIYQHKGKITSETVLEGPTVQTSFASNGTVTGGVTNVSVTEIGTYTTTPRADGILYGEGQGVITGENGEIVTWDSQEIGSMAPNGEIIFRGSIFFRTLSPTGSLGFLDNMVGVFIFQVDPSGNTAVEILELK